MRTKALKKLALMDLARGKLNGKKSRILSLGKEGE